MVRNRNYVTRTSSYDAENRSLVDFYPTPRRAVDQLLDAEPLTGRVWEPACGDGAISRALLARGLMVASTDLYDHGYGRTGINFLTTAATVDHVVTNPPFKLAEAFVRHALACATEKVIMLFRLAWLEGQRRQRLYREHPPARVWVHSERVHFARNGDVVNAGGGGMVAFMWVV